MQKLNNKMEEKRDRGAHLMGTLVGCKPRLLCSRSAIFKLLQHFPKKIGMSLISIANNPLVEPLRHETIESNAGITGICLLWQSHISIHTWEKQNEIDFDVFSCSWFPPEKALKILRLFFGGEPSAAIMVDRNTGETVWRADPIDKKKFEGG